MIQAVIFDMDGLMFDNERMWDRFWAPCCEKMGLPLPPPSFYAEGRGTSGDALRRNIANYYPQIDPQTLLEEVWAYSAVQFRKGVPVKPGLPELLAELERRGVPRIVASSSPRDMILTNLDTTGTRRYFDDVVCGYDVSRSKPAPDIFLEAARRLGVQPEHCVVLEDSFNGVRAGRAAGAQTVMVPDMAQPTPEIAALCTHICRDLFEVKDWLVETGAI